MPDTANTHYQQVERRICQALGLTRRPVAVAFRDTPPAGVSQFTGTEPSGCSFWRLAAAGQTFYTVPADHYNCPIGSYTHAIPLPPERAAELDQTLSLMSGLGYVRMEEIPAIPRLPRQPGILIYSPLGDAPVDPDVVLFAARPGRLMLLQEAALRAGVAPQLPLLARPTCMAIPAALTHHMVTSAGCIGNRVYTDLGEDELYAAVAREDLEKIASEIETIAGANARLMEYHRERRAQLEQSRNAGQGTEG